MATENTSGNFDEVFDAADFGDTIEINSADYAKADENAGNIAGLTKASFEETVEEFDLTKIKPAFSGKKNSIINGMFFVRMALLVACASMFMYCVYAIADRVIESIEEQKLMEELRENHEQPVVPRVPKTNTVPSALTLYDALGVAEEDPTYFEVDPTGKYELIRYNIMELKAKNSDIYGWIRFRGGMLAIDYPIVKSADNNEYYLKKNFIKENNAAGAIFADFRNSYNHKTNFNTVFYGHCMTDGSMFGAIAEWFNSPTRNSTAEQITIEIFTPDAVYVYEIFAAYRSTGADFITVSFANNAKYLDFLKSIQKKSVLKRNLPFDTSSRIITLSTCTNVKSKPDERYVVHGILTKIVYYS
ncbi:MAG: class B sortase [Eubacteriales bacterium]